MIDTVISEIETFYTLRKDIGLPVPKDLFKAVREELNELEEASKVSSNYAGIQINHRETIEDHAETQINHQKTIEEYGDLLHNVICLGKNLGIDPEQAVKLTLIKVKARVKFVSNSLSLLKDLNEEEYNNEWELSKKILG